MKSKYVTDFSKIGYITLQQYLYLKTRSIDKNVLSSSLTSTEIKLFDIKIKKGWYSKDKDKRIPLNIAKRACRPILSDRGIPFKIKRNVLESLYYGEFDPFDEQFLYLIINENGHSKIGISKHPFIRSNGIQNGSGYKNIKITFWALKDIARRVESYLHKEFKIYRTLGEWFSIEISPEQIMEKLPCKYLLVESEGYDAK